MSRHLGQNFPGITMSKCKGSEVGRSSVLFGDSEEVGGLEQDGQTEKWYEERKETQAS